MIIIDHPVRHKGKPGILRGRPFTSSHMISTLYGKEGTEELMEFAKKIGLKPEWLQKPSDLVQQHFDVMNIRYLEAIAAGAKLVSSPDLVRAMMKKRVHGALVQVLSTRTEEPLQLNILVAGDSNDLQAFLGETDVP